MTKDIIQTGCYLDGRRGHYITRDMIWMSEEFGFIIGEDWKFILDMYESHSDHENYPIEAMYELQREAEDWLNSSSSEREIKGQNMPPSRPENHYWRFEDGDYGLWKYDEDGELI